MSVLYHDSPDDSLPTPTSKVCSKCGIEKPLEEFFKAKRGLYGHRAECKVCHQNPRNIITQPPLFILSKVCTNCGIDKSIELFETPGRRRCKKCEHEDTKERVSQKGLATEPKECRDCHIVKSLDKFYKDGKTTGGYSPVCKDCDDKRKRQWDIEHADHIRTRRQARYDPEEQRRRNKAYVEANHEAILDYHHHYYEENKEKLKPYLKKWQQNNLLKCRESNDRRRAIKRKATVEKVDYEQILQESNGICYICEKEILEDDKISFDHKIPLHRDGVHAAWNIKVVHWICNCRKRYRLLEEMTPFQRRGIR